MGLESENNNKTEFKIFTGKLNRHHIKLLTSEEWKLYFLAKK